MYARINHINGTTVNLKVGDWVGFKSDIEQYGEIIKINRNRFGHTVLTLKSEYGFDGDYIGGQTTTKINASQCWAD